MSRLKELTLDEMLADPIVHLMMARDGVAEADLRALVGRMLALQAAETSVEPTSLEQAA